MAETDILNPVQGYWPELGGNPTWDYDYTRKKANNKQEQGARLGPGYSRDIANEGHSFTWNWNSRPLSVIERLEKFYEDFKHGYFTLIDYDNNSRHHVGRFADAPNVRQVGHLAFTVQALTFTEVQTARMLTYPSDFTNWGHPVNVVDDFFLNGNPTPRVAAMQGAWVFQLNPTLVAPSVTDPTAYEAFDAVPAAGDWAQTQYPGWGFQMVLRLAPTLGKINILLDEVAIVTGLDLSSGAAAASTGIVTLVVAAGAVTVTAINVPLDMHRVKIVYAGASAASGVSIIYPQLTYIY